MPDADAPEPGLVTQFLRGRSDRRLRATFRVLVVVVVPFTEALTGGIAAAVGLTGRLGYGAIQAGLVGVLLVGWARLVDRRRAGEYGLDASADWGLNLCVGFLAVLFGFVAWTALGVSMGWTVVETTSNWGGVAMLFALVGPLLGTVLNVWVQETVYTGVVVKNAAEGLGARGLSGRSAVVVAWGVGTVLFTWIHQPETFGDAALLGLGLSGFVALYVLSGSLALPIGVHTAVNFIGGVLLGPGHAAAILTVTNSFTGIWAALNGGAIPPLGIAVALSLAWLSWRRGRIRVTTDLAMWSPRER